jgi:hypothetical protein
MAKRALAALATADLALKLGVILFWRRLPAFGRMSTAANVAIMTAGFVLMGWQLGGLVYGAPV